MKTRTVLERIGERLGDVDWGYDFLKHFNNMCCPPEGKREACDKAIERLKLLLNGEEWEATTYGGWPRCGWGKVLSVGMYDGWPYWQPVPSVAIQTYLGTEWHPFHSITNIRHPGTDETI